MSRETMRRVNATHFTMKSNIFSLKINVLYEFSKVGDTFYKINLRDRLIEVFRYILYKILIS